MGMRLRTVRLWLSHFRSDTRRRKRKSIFDPFAPYVLRRWEEGEHNGMRVWEELQVQGFIGSYHMFYSFMQRLRHPDPIVPTISPEQHPASAPLLPLTLEERRRLATYAVSQTRWMLLREPDS